MIIVLSIFITGFYVLLMGFLIIGCQKLKPFVFKSTPQTSQFSIIIPFRDEAKNLEALLQSLCSLNYPKEQFEIILVNDFSSDEFLPIIEKYKTALPNLICIDAVATNMSPKKATLSLGISKAKFDWIVTTDADCIVPVNWLKAFNQKIKSDHPLMIAGLVKFNLLKGFLNRFQCLDLLSLQATLLGAFGLQKPMLCHGANLCYSKKLFYELNGFYSHKNIASGDDVFLLEAAVKKYPDKIMVLNSLEAVVNTNPEPTIKALLSQRKRWAAKANAYHNWNIKLVGLIVLAMNLWLLTSGILSLFGLFNLKLFWILFLIKFNTDAFMLFPMAKYFKQESALKSYLLSSFLYPVFSVLSVILGLSTSYRWKNRNFKK